jgi:hypothetical protein
MSDLSNEQKTRLREAVLRVSARRPLEPLSVTSLAFHVRQGQWMDCPVDERSVREALAVLQGLGFVAPVQNPLGGIENWKPTADGILYYERNLQ